MSKFLKIILLSLSIIFISCTPTTKQMSNAEIKAIEKDIDIAADSYDAEASTLLMLLDTRKQELRLIDHGVGFSKKAILQVGMLGGGNL